MEFKFKKYINSKVDLTSWSIHRVPKKLKYKYIISIPCYDEYDYIFQTLESINNQDQHLLDDVLVTILVNNSDKENNLIVDNNHKTYNKIITHKYIFDMIVIDAYSKDRALDYRYAGVGKASKISVDSALQFTTPNSLICFIDADSILDSDYLLQINNSYNYNRWECATVNFEHLKDDNETVEFIQEYESLLKWNSLQIKKSGSPYYYVPLGSTMICTVSAYIAVGGMNKKKAAEDFYFLQELQKYRDIFHIKDILIYPSSRSSKRCYLGTSVRMRKCIDGELSINDLRYNENAYQILKDWLELALKSQDKTSQYILNQSKLIHIDLPTFLDKYNFSDSWCGLNVASNKKHFINQFHRWFDAFKTFKLLKEFS